MDLRAKFVELLLDLRHAFHLDVKFLMNVLNVADDVIQRFGAVVGDRLASGTARSTVSNGSALSSCTSWPCGPSLPCRARRS